MKGNRLKSTGGFTCRPTSERVRQSLFDILGERIRNARILDAFAGSGIIGFEAVSRGANHVTFIEQDNGLFEILMENAGRLGVVPFARFRHGDTCQVLPECLRSERYTIIYLDPPYRSELIRDIFGILAVGPVDNSCTIISESFFKTVPDSRIESFARIRTERYGDTAVSFWRKQPETGR